MRALAVIAALAALLLLPGCAGYQLGPTGGRTAGEKSVEVKLFANATMEPRLADPVNFALRRSLQQDGTFRLDTAGESDYIVTGTITAYNRPPVSFQSGDVISVQDYFIQMTAEVKLTERRTGRVIAQRAVTGRTMVRGQSDQTTAERIAKPMLAEDLAKKITSLLADGDW
jgi:hypothetical protein